jgi:tRNA G18 (ribose-2'-O)-methylase SpoU
MCDPDLRKLSFEEIQKARKTRGGSARAPITVVADNVRSLHNIGALFRTADGANIENLLLCGISGTPPRNEIRKTSLGAEESVPWRYVADAGAAVGELSSKGYQIVVLEHTTRSQDYRLASYRFPLCLVVGHEFHGIGDELIGMADLAVDIPMYGVKQSLNVSVAFGIALYEILARLKSGNTLT